MTSDVSPLGIGECRVMDPEAVSIAQRLDLVTRAAARAARRPYFQSLARHFAQLERQPPYALPRAAATLAYVSGFRAWVDAPGVDTLCDPVRVLVEGEGDCLGLSGVLLALLLAEGYLARLVHFHVPDPAPEDHACVEVWNGTGWWYADPKAPHPALTRQLDYLPRGSTRGVVGMVPSMS
jgi:transglutaminase-like putative cysteine protease